MQQILEPEEPLEPEPEPPTPEQARLEAALGQAMRAARPTLHHVDFANFDPGDPLGMMDTDLLRQSLQEQDLSPSEVERAMEQFEKIRATIQEEADGPALQNGGYLLALDEASGEPLWHLQLYTTRYDDGMETDVQDIFVADLELVDGFLLARDESNRIHKVDLALRQVVSVEVASEPLVRVSASEALRQADPGLRLRLWSEWWELSDRLLFQVEAVHQRRRLQVEQAVQRLAAWPEAERKPVEDAVHARLGQMFPAGRALMGPYDSSQPAYMKQAWGQASARYRDLFKRMVADRVLQHEGVQQDSPSPVDGEWPALFEPFLSSLMQVSQLHKRWATAHATGLAHAETPPSDYMGWMRLMAGWRDWLYDALCPSLCAHCHQERGFGGVIFRRSRGPQCVPLWSHDGELEEGGYLQAVTRWPGSREVPICRPCLEIEAPEIARAWTDRLREFPQCFYFDSAGNLDILHWNESDVCRLDQPV